ncbi:MAG: hypothetical protein E6G10_30205 [Actinobacteria bacterium]|nr:MAG: hypothetical protein E6G10_30205 [Actinomycetota bacterium]
MSAAPVIRLTGVYNAEGSLLGELRYVVGGRLGRTHCALCEITHGHVREKAAWRRARRRLAVPFTAVHLDERDQREREASDGRTPCVLAHTADDVRVLLGPVELERCAGDPDALVAAVERALAGAQPVGVRRLFEHASGGRLRRRWLIRHMSRE